MSIRQVLADRVAERRLFEIRPLLSPKRVRSVWVTEEVLNQLSPDTAEPEFELSAGRLRRKLENIVIGTRLIVGDRRDKKCDLKQLSPKRDEVWEIRERDEPSIRIFFRFMERNCFIATNVRLVSHLFEKKWLRHGVEFWPLWWRAIRRCQAIWRALFLTYAPHSGDSLNDYLSDAAPSGSV